MHRKWDRSLRQPSRLRTAGIHQPVNQLRHRAEFLQSFYGHLSVFSLISGFLTPFLPSGCKVFHIRFVSGSFIFCGKRFADTHNRLFSLRGLHLTPFLRTHTVYLEKVPCRHEVCKLFARKDIPNGIRCKGVRN